MNPFKNRKSKSKAAVSEANVPKTDVNRNSLDDSEAYAYILAGFDLEAEKKQREAQMQKITQYKKALAENWGFQISADKTVLKIDQNITFCERSFIKNSRQVTLDFEEEKIQHILITGDAGCGKTTFLIQCAVNDCSQEDVLPFFIPLKNIRTDVNFEEFLKTQQLKINHTTNTWLTENQIHLYLDAADETPQDKKDAVFENINVFLNKYGENVKRVVVSARNEKDISFSGGKLLLNYTSFVLPNFSENEFDTFIDSNITQNKKETFVEKLEKYPDEIKRTPFYLTALLLGFEKKNTLPATLSILMYNRMEKFFDREFDKALSETDQRNLDSARGKLPEFAYRNITAVGGALAYKRILSVDERKILQKRKILNDEGDDFDSQKDKEYFAAIYFYKNSQDIFSLLEEAPETWKNVFTYLLSMWETDTLHPSAKQGDIFKDLRKFDTINCEVLLNCAQFLMLPAVRDQMYQYITNRLIKEMLELGNPYASDLFFYAPKYELYRYAINAVCDYINNDSKFLFVASLVRDLCFTYGAMDFAGETGVGSIAEIAKKLDSCENHVRTRLCKLFYVKNYAMEQYYTGRAEDDFYRIDDFEPTEDYVYPRELSPVHAYNRIAAGCGKNEIWVKGWPVEFDDPLFLYQPSAYNEKSYKGLCFIPYDKAKIEHAFAKGNADISCLSGIVLLPVAENTTLSLLEIDKRSIFYYSMPDNIVEIDKNAYSYMPHVTYIFIPGRMKKITENAFRGIMHLTLYFEEIIRPTMHIALACYQQSEAFRQTMCIRYLFALQYSPELKTAETVSDYVKCIKSILKNFDFHCNKLSQLLTTIPNGVDDFNESDESQIKKILRYNNALLKICDDGYDKVFRSPFDKFGPALRNALDAHNITTLKLIGNNLCKITDMHSLPKLKRVELPARLLTIGSDDELNNYEACGFVDCINLETVIINSELACIHWSAFRNCRNLRDIEIDLNQIFVDKYAFEGCEKLKSRLPEALTNQRSFQAYLFNKFGPDLTSPVATSSEEPLFPVLVLTAEDEETPLSAFEEASSSEAVKNMELKETKFKEELIEKVKTKSEITQEDTHPPSSVVNWIYTCKIVIEADDLQLVTLKDYLLPDHIKVIGTKTFSGFKSLCLEKLPEKLEVIGERAFEDCFSLNFSEIPQSVTTIEAGAFLRCESLQSVSIPASVKRIEEDTFSGCKALNQLDLPHGLTFIGSRAFQGCGSLQSVSIPASVESIEEDTFSGCKALRKLVFSYGLTSIGLRAFYGCNALFDEDADGIFVRCTPEQDLQVFIDTKIQPYFQEIFGFAWKEDFRYKFSTVSLQIRQ